MEIHTRQTQLIVEINRQQHVPVGFSDFKRSPLTAAGTATGVVVGAVERLKDTLFQKNMA
jgi:hypothetical protein